MYVCMYVLLISCYSAYNNAGVILIALFGAVGYISRRPVAHHTPVKVFTLLLDLFINTH